jgi:hypothetical protein
MQPSTTPAAQSYPTLSYHVALYSEISELLRLQCEVRMHGARIAPCPSPPPA